MEAIRIRTLVYAPIEEVYELLLDFEGYPRYSEYVSRVSKSGDGGEGTSYGIELGWKRFTYTAWSRVIELSRPHRIEWELAKHVDASGRWELEDASEEAPESESAATRIRLDAQFDKGSVDKSAVSLPLFFSFDKLIRTIEPLIYKEAARVLTNVVEDLEGHRRTPDLEIEQVPSVLDRDDLESISK